MFRHGKSLRHSQHRFPVAQLMWVPTFAALGCLAVPVTPTQSTSGSLAPIQATPLPTTPHSSDPSATTPGGDATPSPSPIRFVTLAPRAELPDDDTCAEKVAAAEETHPVNASYNATVGSRRLPDDFFDTGSHDSRANDIAARVTGKYTGTTPQILQWTACKWGISERIVRAQAQVESSWRQTMMGDWSSDPSHCAPGHGLGVDGRPGYCPESWGILQVRYRFFRGAFPDAIRSTAFNADTAYAVWRSCYEGYEWWLSDFADSGYEYKPGDAWGCIGRWFSGQWYDELARRYIGCVKRLAYGRPPCE
jgi:autotransporter family porin